ncbi:hypothetical protein [Psittacicella hinzii]|uniref:Lipopolysaccharide export system protein LptA n=1 Tax=Psittacicella hinzii TaxID=2028575 RepID=A0A3A1YJZ0_9GAMM|nr:hypothetical protein [Psittacicella hinzii]RIY37901.1 hypothetical protein CKF58_04465 [Psittacicella hinzii]
MKTTTKVLASLILALTSGAMYTTAYASEVQPTDRIEYTNKAPAQHAQAGKQVQYTQVNLIITGKINADGSVSMSTNAFPNATHKVVTQDGQVVYVSRDITAQQANHIFKALNMTTSLNQGEIMQAVGAKPFQMENSIYAHEYIDTYLRVDTSVR